MMNSDNQFNSIEHPENNKDYKALKVQKGISEQPTVNPRFKKQLRKKRRKINADEYVQGILNSDISILSQAITLIESNHPDHQALGQEVLKRCLPHSGNAVRLGITGVPGAGKSTTIEALGLHLINKGHKLAVLAIDPSSEKSKGSILGDKTRMEQLSNKNDAFIRPSPSAGSLGGVARKTRESIILCEAAGFDAIIVETVGVGQSETAVHSMVDFFFLVMIAGAGDELQGIKRGIMEMADAIAINKADGNNINRAKMAQAEYRNALHLFPASESGWIPPVLTCSAITGTDIPELWTTVMDYVAKTKSNGFFNARRVNQAKYWMYESINEKLKNNFFNNPVITEAISLKEQEVLEDKTSSFVAAADLLDLYFKSLNS